MIKYQYISIKQLKQIDHYNFSITWNDRSTLFYNLSELQKMCPCAKCHKNKAKKPDLCNNVTAKSLHNLGRYALKINFSNGCSEGIYEYSLLYKTGKNSHVENST